MVSCAHAGGLARARVHARARARWAFFPRAFAWMLPMLTHSSWLIILDFHSMRWVGCAFASAGFISILEGVPITLRGRRCAAPEADRPDRRRCRLLAAAVLTIAV